MNLYGEAIHTSQGFVVETWTGELDPKQCSGKLCSPSNDYHCVCVTNERPESMDIKCTGDDTEATLIFERGPSKGSRWKETFNNISPKGAPYNWRREKGAKVHISSANLFSETKVRLTCEMDWFSCKCGPFVVGFNIRLS